MCVDSLAVLIDLRSHSHCVLFTCLFQNFEIVRLVQRGVAFLENCLVRGCLRNGNG